MVPRCAVDRRETVIDDGRRLTLILPMGRISSYGMPTHCLHRLSQAVSRPRNGLMACPALLDLSMGLVQKLPLSLMSPYTNQQLREMQKIGAEWDWCRNSRFPVFARLRVHTALGQDQQTLEDLTAPLELTLMNTGLTDHDAGLSDYNCWNTHLSMN